MNKGELKPLDWVTFLGKNYQINFAGGDIMYLVGRNKYVATVDLSPIPLTKEILEKNGWQWDEVDWVFFCEFCPHVYLAPVGKGFNVVDATGEQLGRINAAVHELQHLLWALGIDDDLKITECTN